MMPNTRGAIDQYTISDQTHASYDRTGIDECGAADPSGPCGDCGRVNQGPSRLESLADGETWTIRLTVEHANGRTREARYLVEL